MPIFPTSTTPLPRLTLKRAVGSRADGHSRSSSHLARSSFTIRHGSTSPLVGGLSPAQLSAVQRVTNLPEALLRRDEEEPLSCIASGIEFSGHDPDAEVCRQCLRGEYSLPALDTFITAERISWAAKRKTTRIEDRAYSLLGLFGVSMPLLYGEGSRAFLRL